MDDVCLDWLRKEIAKTPATYAYVFTGYGSVLERLEQSPSQTINTAYIERSNLDWRLWDAHLARKAPTAARAIRWLKAKFAICIACYNLIRPHETLNRGQDRIFRAKTPAMAAKVADHPWTITELLANPSPCQ